jgi:hypothetical protein
MNYRKAVITLALLLSSLAALATIFGSVRGIIHDPQHRPVQGAMVMIKAKASDWTASTNSDPNGEFSFQSVPLGEYVVSVAGQGFNQVAQNVVVVSGSVPVLHYALAVLGAAETVNVVDTPELAPTDSATPVTLVSRSSIESTPGADQSNSLAMITDYTPGAYMVHDQLHIRGGHQVSWLLDGVPVPNTNIASNVGPQFDPKDIDYLEVQRGGFNAEYGDRTYGVLNVVTRSGFERNRQAELVVGYGGFNNTNDQISFGDHTSRFAYYTSLSGYRTDLGLESPGIPILHDQSAGLGAFASLIFNQTASDQLRLVTSLRGDHYQVPNDSDQQLAGIRDVENERDDFVNFSWLHTFGNGVIATASPFYHFNRAHYTGVYTGVPDPDVVIPEDDRGSNYVGGVASLAVMRGKHNARAGLQVYGGRDHQLFGIVTSDGSNPPLSQGERVWGNSETVFLEDQYKPTGWLTLNGGVRLTHFGESTLSENAADPRVGAAIRIPHLNWVLRAFYGRYYQGPPLLTVNGPLLEEAASQGFDFLPLHGERDEQREFGWTIPFRGWAFDLSNFRTGARNFFDHDVLGNSNIFFPLTLEHARIRGWEATASSPRLAHRLSWRLAYSHQHAEWSGGVTGGLVSDDACDQVTCFLDHDQRDTLTTGFNLALPWRSWADFHVNHGSGFLDGAGPEHLPSHTTYDLSLGKSFGEKWNVRISGLNLSNHRYLLDNSSTFGGTHTVDPRVISVQVKYRFHF